tara:strand:+ start:51 stop:389 length:339 start_codon:yes stop_codon:yes gene_type:complete
MKNIRKEVKRAIKQQYGSARKYAIAHNFEYTQLTRFLAGNRSIQLKYLLEYLKPLKLIPEHNIIKQAETLDAGVFIKLMRNRDLNLLADDLARLDFSWDDHPDNIYNLKKKP